MNTANPRGSIAAAIGMALVVLVIAIPATTSLAHGDGAICFVDSGCPLSAINPCVRQPTFAVVGRCAIPIR